MNLRAVPQSPFTWNYHLLDGDDVIGSTHYSVFGESGWMALGGTRLAIARQGPASGEWRLTDGDGTRLAEARKLSPFRRRIDIRWRGAGTLILEGAHPLTRSMVVVSGGVRVGKIDPDHCFTRKASLHFPAEVSGEVPCFCLWLAVLLWRRAASQSGGG